MGATGIYQLYRVCKYKLALRKQPQLITSAETVAEPVAEPATAEVITTPKVEDVKK